MSREYVLKVKITEKEMESFWENEVLKNRIQELKESEQYKNLPKLFNNPIIKRANNSGLENIKEYLQQYNKDSFEEILFLNIYSNAVSIAFSKFISSGGKADIIETIKEELTTEFVASINDALIESVAEEVQGAMEEEKLFSDLLSILEPRRDRLKKHRPDVE